MREAYDILTRSLWPASPAISVIDRDVADLSLSTIDRTWRPFRQFWNGSATEAGFRPGWAHLSWQPDGLRFEAVLVSSNPKNRALTLNENIWELGDVCEFFLEVQGAENYIELHVTPENQRLQLLWPADGLARFRAGLAPITDFQVFNQNWIQSRTAVSEHRWAVQAFIPAQTMGCDNLSIEQRLRVAVCRYDVGDRDTFVLSSTARLSEPNFHRRTDWDEIILSAAGT